MELKENLKKVAAAAAIFAAIGALAFVIQQRRTGGGDGAGQPKAAPDFALTDVKGKPVRMADLKGRVVLVDFWATWCPPCVEELPHFKELHQKYSPQGLTIVAISLDDSKEQVDDFLEENPVPYTVVFGNNELAEDFGGVMGLPTAFLIDRSGNIVKKLVGYNDLEQFEKVLKDVL